MTKLIVAVCFIAIAMVVVGCTTNPSQNNAVPYPSQSNSTSQISTDALISYKSSGGFINPEVSIQELNLTRTIVTYTIYNSNNNSVTKQTIIPTDAVAFSQVVDSLNNNDFTKLGNTYGGRNPDTGKITLTVNQKNFTKTVIINTLGDTPPGGLISILTVLQKIEDETVNNSTASNLMNTNQTTNNN